MRTQSFSGPRPLYFRPGGGSLFRSDNRAVEETFEELSVEERNLFSVAYKNAVGSRRASWWIVSSVEQKETSNNAENAALASSYRTKVEGELNTVCDDILKLLKDCLIPASTSGESNVFHYAELNNLDETRKMDAIAELDNVSEDPYEDQGQVRWPDPGGVARVVVFVE